MIGENHSNPLCGFASRGRRFPVFSGSLGPLCAPRETASGGAAVQSGQPHRSEETALLLYV